MNQQPTGISYEILAEWLHGALDNLYDTYAIQRNPLADVFGQEQMTRLMKGQNLRKVLLQCIQSLEDGHSPASSPDKQAARILEMRYLENLSVDDTARELSISKSQFFRDQGRAVKILTDIVWDRYQSTLAASPLPPPADPQMSIEVEVERLSTQSTSEVVDLSQLLEELFPTLEMLGRRHSWQVHMRVEPDILMPSSNRIMLRQAILILCSQAAGCYESGELFVTCEMNDGRANLTLDCQGTLAESHLPDVRLFDERTLAIAHELLRHLGAQLAISVSPIAWSATIEWTTLTPAVLVLDDDKGIIELFRRYLVGYPWQVSAASSGAEARRIMETVRPAAILLDVMLPQEDGWEFLATLKRNPATQDIPVIICSVLTSPQLALNLGAVAFLPKPVSQQALIDALARWSQASWPAVPGS